MSVEWIHKSPIHSTALFEKETYKEKPPRLIVKCGEFEEKSTKMSFVHFTRLLVLL